MRHRYLFGHWRRNLLLVAAMLLVIGCVSSPEVKLASSQMTQAIDEYGQNIMRYRDLWVAEIDKTLDDLSRALVVRAVKQRIETLSTQSKNFSNAHWRKQFQQKGMIALSEEIEDTQDAARIYIRKLMKYKVNEAAVQAGIGEFNKRIYDQGIEALEMMENTGVTEIEIQKARAAINAQKLMLADPIIESYGQQIIEWKALKQEVPLNLKNLENVIQALKTTHQTVDGWIQTDVNASGEQVGQLVVKHAGMLGL